MSVNYQEYDYSGLGYGDRKFKWHIAFSTKVHIFGKYILQLNYFSPLVKLFPVTIIALIFTADSGEKPVTKVVFSLIICILGLVGNAVVIFVILVLKEYKKSVTHW